MPIILKETNSYIVLIIFEFCPYYQKKSFMDDTKKKYLAELSGITSPYFTTSSSKSYKLFQQTPSKFSNSSLSEIFPDLSSKLQIKLDSISITNKTPTLSHSDAYDEFKQYIDSLYHIKSIQNELNINFLLTNSNNNHKITEQYIPIINPENLNKKTIIETLGILTVNLRNFLHPNSNGKNIENLWRGAIKLLDYSFILGNSRYAQARREFEDLSDFKIGEVEKLYFKLKEESELKNQELFKQIEDLKNNIANLEGEIGLKARIILEKERKIEEMNSFENKNFTIYRLKRMVKGLTDFITETENEQEKQEKTLEGISKILEITENMQKPPEVKSTHSQTNCVSFINNLNIKELSIPVISQNPLYHFIKPIEKFISISDQELLEFCEDVLRKDIITSYPATFLAKIIEDGKDGEYLHEMINKLMVLQNHGLKWPNIYRKLLGVDNRIIGKFWEFIQIIDNELKSPKYLYFVEFETVANFIYRIFKNDSFIVHRILFQTEFFEPVEESKSFQPSKIKKVEIMLMKLVYELRKKNISILSKIIPSGQRKNMFVTKSAFVSFIQALPMFINERGAIDIWDYLFGIFQNQVKGKVLLTSMRFNEFFEKSRNVYLDKFDIMLRIIAEWEKKQEKFIDCISKMNRAMTIKEIHMQLKADEWELSHKGQHDLFINLHTATDSYIDNQFPSLEVIKIYSGGQKLHK